MAAEPVSHVWAALVQGEGDGADVGAPTMLFCPPHYPHFNVDALKYAAKAQFVQLPANVAAAQLSVSATREGPRVERPSALVQSLGGSSDEQPLYIHAPAPSQGLGADVGSGAALEERFAAFLQTQQERDERLRKEQLQMRKEQQERDERLRKEQLQIIRHLALPENPWAEMARTSAASDTSSQVNFRTQLSAFYGYSESKKPKCIVTQMEDGKDGNRVVAAHVWPRSAASTFPFEHLENGVNNPSNGLFLHTTIEQNMDRLHVCFVCNPFDLSAEFVVLHNDILQQQLPGTDYTFKKLHTRKVQFTYEQRPSFQLLSKHAQQAFAHAGNQQWMEDKVVGDFKKVVQFGSPQSKMHDQRKGAAD